jgi:hypothetical protein
MELGKRVPRHFEFEPKHPYADLTDEELMQRIREIDSQLDTSFRFVFKPRSHKGLGQLFRLRCFVAQTP